MADSQSDIPKTSKPAARALDGAGVRQLADLRRFTEKQIADLHGMGPKALGILKAAMAEKGISFRT